LFLLRVCDIRGDIQAFLVEKRFDLFQSKPVLLAFLSIAIVPIKPENLSAIPADDLRVLCDHGSRQLYPRFDHPFPSFEATSTIRHARVSRCKQTHRAIEA
jgi:hypothetical protein